MFAREKRTTWQQVHCSSALHSVMGQTFYPQTWIKMDVTKMVLSLSLLWFEDKFWPEPLGSLVLVVLLFCNNLSRRKNAHVPPIIQSPIQIGPADGRQDGTMQADDALYPELCRTRMRLVKHFAQSRNTYLGFLSFSVKNKSRWTCCSKNWFIFFGTHESTWNAKWTSIMSW